MRERFRFFYASVNGTQERYFKLQYGYVFEGTISMMSEQLFKYIINLGKGPDVENC